MACYRHAAENARPVTRQHAKDRHDRVRQSQDRRRHRLHRQGHRPRRLRPQGNLARRDRNARPDGDPRGVRPEAAAEGRAHRRLAAHDDPDRGADRDADGARRRRALGVVQHLFDPGPRGRRDRGGRHSGVRRQGRDPEGLLGLHRQAVRLARRRHAEHDPRRRRRRHDVRPSRPARREGRHRVPRQAGLRGRGSVLRAAQAHPEGEAEGLLRRDRQDHQGRLGRDHHRRASSLRHAEGRHAAVARHQRQRLGHQVEVRQPLWLPRVAGRRHPPRHRRDDGRQGRDGRGLRRRRQGLGRVAAPGRLPRDGVGDRSDLRAAGGDGRLPGRHDGRRRADAPTSSSPRPATRTSSRSSTCGR